MRKQNVIIFSSSVSLDFVNRLSALFEDSTEVNVVTWKQYFNNAYSTAYQERKAFPLFRVLTKRIPSFDFAIVVAGKDDIVLKNHQSDKKEESFSMRDNVIFELGMCCMALGENRVILLHQKGVKLLADLRGLNTDQWKQIGEDNKRHSTVLTSENIQIRAMDYSDSPSLSDLENLRHDIEEYIIENRDNYAPVVVGAAASTAAGYFGNFIVSVYRSFERFFNNNRKLVLDLNGDRSLSGKIRRELTIRDIQFHVLIPNEEAISRHPQIMKNPRWISSKLYKSKACGITEDCLLNTAKSTPKNSVSKSGKKSGRKQTFACKIIGNKLHIIDIPTTILASYKTATAILNMEDDAFAGEKQKLRYISKELSMFTAVLQKLLVTELPEADVAIEFISMNSRSDEKQLPWLYE